MGKLYYLHLVTGVVAAGVVFIPRQSVASAIAAGFVAGGGSAVAQTMTQRSLRQRVEENSTSEAELELKKQKGLLQQYREEITRSKNDRERLSHLIDEKDRLIAEIEGALRASSAEQKRLSDRIQERDQQIEEKDSRIYEVEQELKQIAQSQGSLESVLADQQNLTQLLQKSEQKVQDQSQILEMYEQEVKILKDNLAGFQETVEFLMKDYRRGDIMNNSSQSSIVFTVTEHDLYPGEIKSFIWEILYHKKSQVHENSRVYHILDDLTRHNDALEGKNFRDNLKFSLERLFRDYQKWNNNTLENELQRLQFDIVSMNDHIKICFSKDNRYAVTFAKTASDWWVGLNILRDIRKTIFGITE